MAVIVGLRRRFKRNLPCLCLTKAVQQNGICVHVGGDLPLGAADFQLPGHIGGKGRHGEIGDRAFVERKDHHLPVHHIVVAAVYAAAVGPFPQRF